MIFNIGTEVVVYRNAPQMSFKGVIVDAMDAHISDRAYYKVLPNIPSEKTAWFPVHRLKLAPIYQCMDSWDGDANEKSEGDV